MHVRLRVGAEAYALPVENVLEVAQLGQVASVPGSGPYVLGVYNLRGEVLPVFDLAKLFGIERDAEPDRLLVTEHAGRKAGFAVGEVSDVGELPDAVQEAESDFLSGASLLEGELIGIIDVPRVFDALERGGAG